MRPLLSSSWKGHKRRQDQKTREDATVLGATLKMVIVLVASL